MNKEPESNESTLIINDDVNVNQTPTIKPNARCKLCYGTGSVKRFVRPDSKDADSFGGRSYKLSEYIGKMDLCDCVKIKIDLEHNRLIDNRRTVIGTGPTGAQGVNKND